LKGNTTGYRNAINKTVVLTRRVMAGDGSMARLFPAKSLAIFLGTTTNTVRAWERWGKIPRTPYRDGGETYYTWEMMRGVQKALKENGGNLDSREIELMWRRVGVPLKAQSWKRALVLTTSPKDE
jgi:hypothetical protein